MKIMIAVQKRMDTILLMTAEELDVVNKENSKGYNYFLFQLRMKKEEKG